MIKKTYALLAALLGYTVSIFAMTGSGTNEDPYKIETADDLYEFAKIVNRGDSLTDAILKNDIIINEKVLSSDGNLNNGNFKEWTPIHKYSGTFDGNRHMIKGLYCYSKDDTLGLFRTCDGATIKRLGIEDSYMEVKDSYVAAICGYAENTSIYECWNAGTIKGYCRCIAGICGKIKSSSIHDCYNKGRIIAKMYTAGICDDHDGNIYNCFNVGSLESSTKWQIADYDTFKTCYGSKDRKESLRLFSGEVAFLLQEKSDPGTWGQKIGIDSHPILWGDSVYSVSNCTKQFSNEKNIEKQHQRDGHNCLYCGVVMHDYLNCHCIYCAIEKEDCEHEHLFEYGYCLCGERDSTQNNWIEIANINDLYEFNRRVNAGNYWLNARVVNDIIVNDCLLNPFGNLNHKIIKEWTPLGDYEHPYMGSFDGNRHTINGLYYKKNQSYAGFVAYNKGIIKNLGIKDSYFYSEYDYLGSICGVNNGLIENCYNESCVVDGGNQPSYTAKAYYVGGICGINNKTITKCHNSSSVVAQDYLGGIAGLNNGEISLCYNISENIHGSNTIGGISGANKNTIINCYNTGGVFGSQYMGGISGLSENGSIANCYNTGYILGWQIVDWICGSTRGECSIVNCYYNECNDVDEPEFATGEIAYKLQEPNATHVWGQRIGVDKYPQLMGDTIYYYANNYTNTPPSLDNCVSIASNNNSPAIYTLDRNIYVDNANGTVILNDINGITIDTKTGSSLQFEVQKIGIYVVITEGKGYKVIIK